MTFERISVDIATGGEPVKAVTAAALKHGAVAGRMTVAHDPGCPCTERSSPLVFCTCEIVELSFTRAV